MILLSFRIRRPKAIANVTSAGDVRLHVWCNLETDFVQVLGDDDGPVQVATTTIASRFGPNLLPASSETAGRALLVPCPANPTTSVSVTVERHSGLVLPPIVAEHGWDTFRVVLFDDQQAKPLLGALASLGEVETLSKRPLRGQAARPFLLPAQEVLDTLTRRQAEALVSAAREGYYEEPRRTTLDALARQADLGRASLEEHLRKAENKVLRGLAPFVAIRLRGLAPTRSRGQPFAGKRRGKPEHHSKAAKPHARK